MENQSLERVLRKPKSVQDLQGEIKDLLPQTARTLEDIGQEVPDPVEDAKTQNKDWHDITEHVTMNFRGKSMSFNDIVIYVRKTCEIGTYSDLTGVRSKEEKIGNLISDIYIQKAKAQYAFGKLEGQRLARLGSFIGEKDRRSTTVIEARAASTDEHYQAIIELTSDCKSTLDFWMDMYNICMRATERLKQISMALMAEMKLEPTDNGGSRGR